MDIFRIKFFFFLNYNLSLKLPKNWLLTSQMVQFNGYKEKGLDS